MKEEYVKKILDSLYEGTKEGAVIWKLRNTIFNSDTRHNMNCFSNDGETEFQIEIHLDDTLKHKPGTHFYIRNKKITDGYATVSSYKSVTLKELENLVFDKFVKPTITPKFNDYVFEDILKNIGSKEYMRDKKLEQILGEEDNEETKVEEQKKKNGPYGKS